MNEVETCTVPYVKIGDHYYKRNTIYFDVNERCHDCNILNEEGNIHHQNCDMERCSRCARQNISCLCNKLGKENLKELPEKSKLEEGLVDHARKELEIAGLFDKDSDYDGMLGEAVIELLELFAKQDHSGMSAAMVRELFSRLSNFEQLTELTDNPDEWMDVSEFATEEKLWQSNRNPGCFSSDGGKTYWNIDDDYFFREDEDGTRWSGGLSEEEYDNRPMYTSVPYVAKEKKDPVDEAYRKYYDGLRKLSERE